MGFIANFFLALIFLLFVAAYILPKIERRMNESTAASSSEDDE